MNTNILLSIWLGNIAMCALFALDAHKSNSWELLTCGSLIVSSFGVLNMSLFVHSSITEHNGGGAWGGGLFQELICDFRHQ